jgi:transcriptional regulator with XRE-family HTH domain
VSLFMDGPDTPDFLARRIGTNLRIAREAKNLSQRELAFEMLGDSNTISRWERGLQQPGPKNLLALARALGINVADLLVPIEDEQEPNGDPVAA